MNHWQEGVHFLCGKEIIVCTENVIWLYIGLFCMCIMSLLGVCYLCSKEISMRTKREAHKADG